VKLLLAAVLALVLSSVALAAPETHQIGPYKVSFDMNTPMKYQIQMLTPQSSSSSTVYPLLIGTNNSTGASIAITEYKSPMDSTIQMQEALTFYRLATRGLNATAPMNQTIDGKNGFLISAVPFSGSKLPAGIKEYVAQYWPESQSYGPVSAGTESVDITSTYPQDVTMNLLKSISIVKSA
jgi:hypothetical protein